MLRLAVLLSGMGRSLDNLQQAITAGRLRAGIAVVISSKPEAYGLVRAKAHGLDAVVVSRRGYPDLEAFNTAINAVLASYDVDLVVLAGFLSLYQPPPALAGRVMNIHPALLPAFGGKGFYGDRVHRAVLDAGVKVSGCTVHFADSRYDHGPHYFANHRAGARRRHGAIPRRARLCRRVRGLPTGHSTIRRRPAAPARATGTHLAS